MSIANGTTYYDYPQVQLTDRPTFADYNSAFADIDAKLYGLITGAITDEADIATLKEDMAQAKLDIVAAQGTADRADGKADVNAENITLLQGSVGAVERDVANKLYSVAIAEPYDATTGTYSVGDVVVYNGQRYVCTTPVAVAEPFDADKWTGEDVQEVLEDISDDITEINANLTDKANKTWTLIGTATGSEDITIPNTYSEVLFIATTPDAASFTFNYPIEVLANTDFYPTSGGYSSGSNSLVNLHYQYTTRKLSIFAVVSTGTDVKASTTVVAYGR